MYDYVFFRLIDQPSDVPKDAKNGISQPCPVVDIEQNLFNLAHGIIMI